MIDIYNEVGYIKNVIDNGLSQKWERDVTLLVRYYKDYEGKKKAWIKSEIKNKCLQASTRTNDPIQYDPLISYKRLNKIIDSAYKKDVPLREIHSVSFPREVLDWFLSLETTYSVTPEEQSWLKSRRPSLSIKNNLPLNWNRTKYLFTLYIWTLIQSNYLDRPDMHYLKQYQKRFKEDADLKPSFNLQKERDLLYDLQLIDVNFSLGIQTKFTSIFPVFSTPITDENRISLTIKDEKITINNKEYLVEGGDLHNPGYWLEKQKMGSFTCQECGKEFAHYSKTPREKARKYCKECGLKKKNHTLGDSPDKIIYCCDCGKEVHLAKKDNVSTRCYNCQKKHKAKLTLDAYHNKNNSLADQSDYLILGEPLDL